MEFPSSDHNRSRNQRLMRQGFVVTGGGVFGLMASILLLFEGAGWPPLTVAALVLTGLLATAAGFGLMVVAADPFGECESDPYSDSEATERPPAQG